jgi:hypothetical protein
MVVRKFVRGSGHLGPWRSSVCLGGSICWGSRFLRMRAMRFVLGLLPWVSTGKDWKRIWWTMLTMKSETYTSRNRDILRVVGGDVVEWRS